jgi:hypothetical protein
MGYLLLPTGMLQATGNRPNGYSPLLFWVSYATWYCLILLALPGTGTLVVLLFEGLPMGCFVLFLHQTFTGVCPVQMEDSPVPAAREY